MFVLIRVVNRLFRITLLGGHVQRFEDQLRTQERSHFPAADHSAVGGDPGAVMDAAATDEGPVLVNSSRSILYASEEADYADAAAEAARTLREALRSGETC